MVSCDIVLKGGLVVLSDGSIASVDLGIDNGKIVEIASEGVITNAREVVEIKGLVVLPGVIDSHIHLGHGSDIRRPRTPSDANSETASAAAGGVTTFLSYLIASEPYENEIFSEACEVTAAAARIDFGFHFVISTEKQLASIPMYVAKYGVPSIKIFMYNRGGEGARLSLPDIDDGFLYRLAEVVSNSNGIICPHCENIEVAWVLRERLLSADPDGEGGLSAWYNSRPPFLEAEAVHRVSTIARQLGAAVHMVHCSSAEGLAAAVAQRSMGANLTVETCVQYLTHDIDWPGGIKAKVNPPLRRKADVESLWAGLAAGEIHTVATDHVHRGASSKQGGIWKASPGFPGLETLLPVLLSEGYHKRGLPLGRIAALLSSNPARVMGCTSKGSIAVGKDADFAIVDLNREWIANEREMKSDAGFSIYDGWQFRGKVVHTIVRGKFALRDGRLCESAIGTGQFVHRSRDRLEHLTELCLYDLTER